MVDDPYCWPGTDCLKNKLGIRDAIELEQAEAKIVSIRDVQVVKETIPGIYDLAHLLEFHRVLFADVYEWAGKTRRVNIHKGGSSFAVWQHVDEQVRDVLAGLADDEYLANLDREDFLDRLAYYYCELNARHPFREGNGRAQRALFRQLAASAGWILDWSNVSKTDNDHVCAQNMVTAEHEPMIEVLRPAVSRFA